MPLPCAMDAVLYQVASKRILAGINPATTNNLFGEEFIPSPPASPPHHHICHFKSQLGIMD